MPMTKQWSLHAGGRQELVWIPATTGENLIADFCSRSNVFCSADDLNAWRRQVPGEGDAVTVVRAAALGERTWSNVADLVEVG